MKGIRLRGRGFTLVEMLVAVVVLGFVLAALLALVTGTTTFTARATTASDSLRDVSDATGYLGDAYRAAIHVHTSPTFETSSGGSVACAISTCVAFETPVFDQATGDAAGTVLQVFSLVPRSEIPASWRANRPWSESSDEVFAIVRYVESTDTPGTLESQPSLLLDNVVHGDPAPYDVFSLNALSGTLVISVQVARVDRSGVIRTPATGPLATTVTRRN